MDPSKEKVIPLADAPRHPLLRQGRRAGRPIHRATLERWRTRGVGGITLETMKLGGVRVTSDEAVRRFIERVNEPGATNDTVTPSDRQRQVVAAERRLAAAGI